MNYLILLLIPLLSGSVDSFDDEFIHPSIAEQKIFKNLLEKLLKLDINKKDVSEILDTFEKPLIITFPCDKTDVNELVINVIETRHSGFSVPEEHQGGVILGGTYSWQCKITTNSEGVITMDCDNTLKLNPDVITAKDIDPKIKEVENLVILYHELLHGQLMLDAISSSDKWRNDVCNKTPADEIDYSYSDKEHVIINPLQEEFTSQLIEQIGGLFLVKEISPEETDNDNFLLKITSRDEHPQILSGDIQVTYRTINMDEPSITFPDNDITLSGTLRDSTKPGTVWVYLFEATNAKPDSTEIPQWIKNNAGWWSDGTISDLDFLNGIEYLIQNDIMKIHNVNENPNPSQEIPTWIRNNAEWWSSGLISDGDFVAGIKYLIEVGIIAYQ